MHMQLAFLQPFELNDSCNYHTHETRTFCLPVSYRMVTFKTSAGRWSLDWQILSYWIYLQGCLLLN